MTMMIKLEHIIMCFIYFVFFMAVVLGIFWGESDMIGSGILGVLLMHIVWHDWDKTLNS